MSVVELGIVIVAAPAGQALWDGVRVEVAAFAADVTAATLDAIRAALDVPRRERAASSELRRPSGCRGRCCSCGR